MQRARTTLPYFKIGFIGLLVAGSFWSIFQQLSSARQLVDTDGPFLVDWEKRFEPIKAGLPFTHGVIGYIADWDVPGVAYDPANSEAELVLTQYTLTPIVVSRGSGYAWTLVNLDAANFETWFSSQTGEFELTRYKYNLYLVHKIK